MTNKKTSQVDDNGGKWLRTSRNTSQDGNPVVIDSLRGCLSATYKLKFKNINNELLIICFTANHH